MDRTVTRQEPVSLGSSSANETTYCGIDNGTSGSIGVIRSQDAGMFFMPVKNELSYTKEVRRINRVDWRKLRDLLPSYIPALNERNGAVVKVFIERPFVNPMMFRASLSAVRALEATLIVLEAYKLPIQYVDSKQWQKVMLPSGLKGASALKKASHDIGCRLFPSMSGCIDKHGDADGLLMAEAARRGKW